MSIIFKKFKALLIELETSFADYKLILINAKESNVKIVARITDLKIRVDSIEGITNGKGEKWI